MTITTNLIIKNARHAQIRLYLPNDIITQLKKLSPPIRNAILAARLRAMAWDGDLDPVRLQSALEALREACVLARQGIRKERKKLVVLHPSEQILDIIERLIRP
jgi:hypothetical protein